LRLGEEQLKVEFESELQNEPNSVGSTSLLGFAKLAQSSLSASGSPFEFPVPKNPHSWESALRCKINRPRKDR
jgi:hypothetical protein